MTLGNLRGDGIKFTGRHKRMALVAVLILVGLSTTASAYTGCNKYRFGSQGWWFCVSDKDRQGRKTISDRPADQAAASRDSAM